MLNALQRLRNGVVVLCYAEGDDPFNQPESMAAFAKSAQIGGADGIRAQEAENIKAIRAAVSLPIIGISKGIYPDGWVLVTPDFDDVEKVIEAGADIVALDVTARTRPNGLDGFQFLEQVRKRFDTLLMADVSTYEEGLRAADCGADAVATTLSGYTPATEGAVDNFPDFNLLERLTPEVHVPVVAEGRIWSPSEAAHAIKCGAFAVVVGSAVTRPQIITRRFVETVKNL